MKKFTNPELKFLIEELIPPNLNFMKNGYINKIDL